MYRTTLDPDGAKIYWTESRGVYRANLDGTQVEPLATDLNRVIALVVASLTPTATDDESPPISYRLHPAYQNPFNPSTTISFDLRRPRPPGSLVPTLCPVTRRKCA